MSRMEWKKKREINHRQIWLANEFIQANPVAHLWIYSDMMMNKLSTNEINEVAF